MVFRMMNTWHLKHVEDTNIWIKTLIWKKLGYAQVFEWLKTAFPVEPMWAVAFPPIHHNPGTDTVPISLCFFRNATGWIMSFHNRQVKVPIKPQVSLNGLPLEYVADQKFLGIHITETLNWNIHLQTVAHKLSTVAFIIRSLKENLSPFMIRHIYFTKFQAILCSGILFWGE